ncbi:hypothetical protein BC628DRAFT_1346617 [Trametes gibbosa]|nr:hypothetical protein BC628DRAFT_1346617 [Trametes gibbosa]
MDDALYNPPGSPPPPAYEISQNEFDQKTRRVVEESAREPPEPRVDEDGFEVWDDAVFAAALAGVDALSVGGSSTQEASGFSAQIHSTPSVSQENARVTAPEQSPPAQTRVQLASGSTSAGPSSAQTRPLKVSKKTRPGKERPSWYDEAGLGVTSSKPTARTETLRAEASVSPSGDVQSRVTRGSRRQLAVINDTGDVPGAGAAQDSREGTPPPEFTPVGPDLDGPPYEEAVVMSYDGPELEPPELDPGPPAFDSLPQSYTPQPPPLPQQAPPQPPEAQHIRPHAAHAQSPPIDPPTSTLHPNRPHVDHAQSMPPVPIVRTHDPTAAIPVKTYKSHTQYTGVPRVSFDHRMAYGKPLPSVPQDEEPLPQQVFGASAFYNHAVAAHFTPNLPAHMRKQSVQSDRSSVYSQDWAMPVAPASNYGHYGSPPDQSVPSVVSPRPSYAYGQAAFPDSTPNPVNTWNPSGGSQPWR